jgi:hypothetical protein
MLALLATMPAVAGVGSAPPATVLAQRHGTAARRPASSGSRFAVERLARLARLDGGAARTGHAVTQHRRGQERRGAAPAGAGPQEGMSLITLPAIDWRLSGGTERRDTAKGD